MAEYEELVHTDAYLKEKVFRAKTNTLINGALVTVVVGFVSFLFGVGTGRSVATEYERHKMVCERAGGTLRDEGCVVVTHISVPEEEKQK